MFPEPYPEIGRRGKSQFIGDLFLGHTFFYSTFHIIQPYLIDERPDGSTGIFPERVCQIGTAVSGILFQIFIGSIPCTGYKDVIFYRLDHRRDLFFLSGKQSIRVRSGKCKFRKNTVYRITQIFLYRMFIPAFFF